MKKRVMIVSILFALALSTFAQKWSTNVTPEELATQKQVLVERFPGVFVKESILGIHKIDLDHSVIIYKQSGVYSEAFINSGGKNNMMLIETDQLISDESCPAIVKVNALKGKYTNWKIKKVFKVTTPSTGILYRVDVSEDGTYEGKFERLYFDDKGEYHKEPSK